MESIIGSNNGSINGLQCLLKKKYKRNPDFPCRVFLFRVFFWLCFFWVHRNRLRVFVFRVFIFWFASKGLAVEKTKHSRLLHPPSFGRCILTARQFMRGAQLPQGSGHYLRSRTVRLPCRRSFAPLPLLL